MKNKIKATIATTEIDKSSERFTEECLKKIKIKNPVVVKYNFEEPIGTAHVKFNEKRNTLEADIKIDIKEIDMKHDIKLIGKAFVVEGISRKNTFRKDVMEHDDLELLAVSLVDNPTDERLRLRMGDLK